MKIKRALFILILIVLFVICLTKMNESYDDLGRYQFELTEEERKLVLDQFSTEDINYLVEQQIEPKQFLPYLLVDGFDLSNTKMYNIAYRVQPESKEFIVNFINKYRSHLSYKTIEDVLSHYSYNLLMRFFDEGDGFLENPTLLPNPTDLLAHLESSQTLYHYEPTDLVSINDLPHRAIETGNDILVRKEVVKPLHALANAMKEIEDAPFGNMEIIAAYLSFENQYILYDISKERFGDDIDVYWDVPGRNEYQLGYTIQLSPKEDKKKDDKKDDKKENKDDKKEKDQKKKNNEKREQAVWLQENAYKYGFVIRYPKDKLEVTGKEYQPYTLRYVGQDLAKYMYDHNLTIEEVNLQDME